MASSSSSPTPSKDHLEDYWNEFKTIEQTASSSDHSDDDELSKTPDEGEVEAAWLDAAGYGFVVNTFQDGKDLSDGELDNITLSLTRAQAQAVRRRIDTLSNTLRRRGAPKPGTAKLHVRDIFSASPPASPTPGVNDDGETNGQAQERIAPLPSSNRQALRHSISSPPSEVSMSIIQISRRSDPTVPSFLQHNKGGYSINRDSKAYKNDNEVQTLGIHPKSASPTKDRPDFLSESYGHLPSVSDIEISLDFHLEELEKPASPTALIPDPQRVDLPAFEAKPDSLGVTSIGDLALCDMAKIRPLAHIELTALLDHHNIIYSRPKRKKKGKEQGIYGVPLDVLMEQDRKRQTDNIKVPLAFQAMVTYLEKEGLHAEGILRLSGSETTIKQLRSDLEEKFYQGLFSWGDCGPHCVAALLKQFLRELPIPLLSNQHLDAFPSVSAIPKTLEQLKALNLLILLLPDEHRDTLKVLLQFLRRVISHSNENKMGLNNVSMIMAPNLFVPAPLASKAARTQAPPNLEMELKKAAETSSMVKMLIHYQDVLWTVPSAFIAQIRHQYITEAHRKSRDKMLMRLPWKKDKDRSELYRKPTPTPEQPEPRDGVIRVQAPHLTKSSALVQLDQFTTAADVVAKFRFEEAMLNRADSIGEREESQGHTYRNPNNALYAQDTDFLYEVGGNIAERCLDPRTKMLDLYHVNPTAEWVIRVHNQR